MRINAIDGTMKKGDRASRLRREELCLAGVGRGGGSDRKMRRPSHLLDSLTNSEGRLGGAGRRRIYS